MNSLKLALHAIVRYDVDRNGSHLGCLLGFC